MPEKKKSLFERFTLWQERHLYVSGLFFGFGVGVCVAESWNGVYSLLNPLAAMLPIAFMWVTVQTARRELRKWFYRGPPLHEGNNKDSKG